jgi:non-canonical purine NTP pyrophosphatase (RdgB/HAM1 family)
MNSLVFSTGNPEKFLTAKHTCDKYGIQLMQRDIDITEIQEEDPEKVARDKAMKAYEVIKAPVVITDDAWTFFGLRGFPGVYMHSINKWFTPEDFLRLVLPLEDRSVMLTQHLIYTDDHEQKVFIKQTRGTLLKEIRGESTYPSFQVITLDGDNGVSIAEAYDLAHNKSTRKSAQVWHDFAEWFSGKL